MKNDQDQNVAVLITTLFFGIISVFLTTLMFGIGLLFLGFLQSVGLCIITFLISVLGSAFAFYPLYKYLESLPTRKENNNE